MSSPTLKGSLVMLSIALVTAGCSSAPKVVHSDVGTITIEHKESKFKEAMGEATKHCLTLRKGVEHKTTSCHNTCISTFACVTQ